LGQSRQISWESRKKKNRKGKKDFHPGPEGRLPMEGKNLSRRLTRANKGLRSASIVGSEGRSTMRGKRDIEERKRFCRYQKPCS